MPPGYGVYIPLKEFAKLVLWLRETKKRHPERLIAGQSTKTLNLALRRKMLAEWCGDLALIKITSA
jgi:hypothetical protein